ncbi:MAG: dihydropteroate synthase [Candidatus Deferrimicrobiaceae bacterium]
MIRVLHFTDPEQARHRIAFLGASEDEAERLVSHLRAILVSVPWNEEKDASLPALLGRRGIPHARGRNVLLFSVASKRELDRTGEAASGPDGILASVREAIDRYQRREFLLRCRDRLMELSGAPRIMGVLNVTPDSFSDGGTYLPLDRAVERGREMAGEGADIIDVGGESTRPGSAAVPYEVERDRVIPVLRALAGKTEAILSVDTTKARVAREAIDAGARIVNDTSALADDSKMADVVRDSGCAVVLMHRRGTPQTMQQAPTYGSLFDEVLDELTDRVKAAQDAGIPGDRILVDPGIGFGKRLEDNLALHRHLADLRNLGKPILFGPSRKSFIGKITGKDPGDRTFGTAATVAIAALSGAHVIRVHDVKEMRDAIRMAAAVAGGVEC